MSTNTMEGHRPSGEEEPSTPPDSTAQDLEPIHCRIAFWYYRRMALIVALLVAGGLWFLYDGKVGWPKKNVVALAKGAFEAGKAGATWEGYAEDEEGEYADAQLDPAADADSIALIKEAFAEGGKKMPWSEFAISTAGKEAVSEAGQDTVKEAFDAGAADPSGWAAFAAAEGVPEEPSRAAKADVDRVVALKTAYEASAKGREWGLYGASTGRKKWGEDVKYHTRSEIQGQYAFAYALWAIALGTLVWAVINSRRSLSAGPDSFTTETGVTVPFSDVFRIDKRKWDNKGLAYAFYRTDSNGEKRAILDDLKYVGTHQILDRLIDNFEGELVERVSADETDAAEESGGDGRVPNAESAGEDGGRQEAAPATDEAKTPDGKKEGA